MKAALARTKIILPRRRQDLVSRTRLLTMLEDLLDYPLTLISAPAGYGKTTLLIDVATQAEFPVCWYSLDPLDQEPQRFLHFLICSIQTRFPGFGKRTSAAIENQNYPLADPDQLALSLATDLYETISEHFAVFLDDFHLVENNPQLPAFISALAKQLDDNTHLVITSRTVFNFPDLSLMIGRRMVKGVDFQDLAFKTDEIQLLYHEVYHQAIASEACKKLREDTEGWITALLLRGPTFDSNPPLEKSLLQVSKFSLAQYLAEQVFDSQPPAVQDFLLRSSIFEEFNRDLCLLVLGEEGDSWEHLLDQVLQNNLFIQQVDAGGPWVRYHQLFLDFLRECFHQYQPEKEKELLAKLIEVYSQEGSWEKAYQVAARLADPALTARVIDQASADLFHSGRVVLLSSWLDQLLDSGYKEIPWLYAFNGLVKTELGDPKSGIRNINKYISLSIPDKKSEELIKAYTWKAFSSRMAGNYFAALENGQIACELAQEYRINNSPESLREIGLAYWHLGDHEKSINHLNDSLATYKSTNKSKNIALVELDIGNLQLLHGDFISAKKHYMNALDIWEALGNIHKLSNLMNNIGYLEILLGNYAEAYRWLIKAHENSISTSNRRTEALISATLGDLALSISLPRIGEKYYLQAREIAKKAQDYYLETNISINLSSAYRIRKNYYLANKQINISKTYVKQSKSQLEQGLLFIEYGFFLIDQKLFKKAGRVLNLGLSIFKSLKQPIDLAKIIVGLAIIEIHQKNINIAKELMIEVNELLNNLGTCHPLLPLLHQYQDEIKPIIEDEAELEELNLELNLFSKALPQLQQELFPPTCQPAAGQKGLQIQAFGQLEVRQQGERLSASEWIHHKTVRELLFYLLSRPQGVSKEEIGLTFWPESSPRQLTCQFKNAVYRLRRGIGKHYVIYDPNYRLYRFNTTAEYSYDVQDFQDLIKEAGLAPDHTCRIDLLQQALDLYRHPFGPQLDGIWAEPLRHTLYLAFERAAMELATWKLEKGLYMECLEICSRVLDIEPCQEEAFQISMRACASCGDITGIIRYYKICEENLSYHLGLTPSQITSSLFEDLTRR